MWKAVVGFVVGITAIGSALVWKRTNRLKLLNERLGTDSLLSADRSFREGDITSKEDIEYCNRVQDRMKQGKGCLHPPLYDRGGSSGEDEA